MPEITYQLTTERTIDRFEIDVEIDDVQDTSFLDGRNGSDDINHSDPEIRKGVRWDAIYKARHGKSWGFVVVIVRSQPDNVVRASLGGIDVWSNDVFNNNSRARANADGYFATILSDLLTEARDEVHEEHVTDSRKGADRVVDSLPVVDSSNAPVDGAALRFAASNTVDWWVR